MMRAAQASVLVLLVCSASAGCGGGSKASDTPSGGAAGRPDSSTAGSGGGGATGAAGASPVGGSGGGGGGAGSPGDGGSGATSSLAGSGGAPSTSGAGGSAGAAGDGPTTDLTPTCSAMVEAANAFLAALTEPQRTAAEHPFGESRNRWQFTPPATTTDGAQLGQVSAAARLAADAFLKAGVSDRGFLKASIVQQIEAATQRDPYYLAVFGTPSTTGSWGWRFQGHHLSLNFTVVGCASIISNTPAFYGANPSTGVQGGMAPLASEEDMGRAFFLALTSEQQETARVPKPGTTTPTTERVDPFQASGLPASAMTPAQVDGLRQLVGEYLGNMTPLLAAARLAEIQDAGFDQVAFAWSGSTTRGQAHYYRIQGPTFLIEYDNNNGTHIHSVWRDFDGDFGPDQLMLHYQQFPHP